ncbi:MAG: phosphomethylpyrimidine synthase ThiC [Planctomycetota bacterium]
MTQLQSARQGAITAAMTRVAQRENVSPEFIRAQVAAGRVVIPANVRHLSSELPGANSELRPAPASPRTSDNPQATLPDSLLATRYSQLSVNSTVSDRRAWLETLRKTTAPLPLDPSGIGRSLTTKINANLGASPLASTLAGELQKLDTALLYGADAVMDLSTGGDLDACRAAFIAHSPVPVGTVPIYSMIIGRTIEDLDRATILKTIEHQARQGVDFFTIHAGILREHLPLIRRRVQGLVSRGGSLIAKWMLHHNRQNPFFELFDEISAIMREYDVTYSLGDGVRPGCLADASDPGQLAELHVLGDLVHRARDAGVQVMVEGPGHVPLNEVAFNMETQRRICDDAPFYILGPVVTDVFPGYDHITSAIGATEAARAGAAMLCYVTPSEHLGLPTLDDVKQGCIAYKIAAHAGDVARGVPGARAWDDAMARARANLDWPRQFDLAFDGETACERHRMSTHAHGATLAADADYCSMCGRDWCSQRISREVLRPGAHSP